MRYFVKKKLKKKEKKMEEDDNLVQFADDCWNDVFLNVQDAAVFLDYSAAECLHWNMGKL